MHHIDDIDDITSWSEAFSIYSLILASHYPSRWRDLTSYKLLILRTYRQFQGNAWLTYDRAFREHAAAARLTDCSSINVQLFNFHAAASSVRRSLPNQAGVLLPSSVGLGTTGSAWLLPAFAASLIAARFVRPTIEPRSAPSARNQITKPRDVQASKMSLGAMFILCQFRTLLCIFLLL